MDIDDAAPGKADENALVAGPPAGPSTTDVPAETSAAQGSDGAVHEPSPEVPSAVDLDTLAAESSAEVRRVRYQRKKQLEAFLKETGGSTEEAVNLLYEVDRLVPDALAFSSGASLAERFEQADAHMKLVASPLYIQPNEKINFDPKEDDGKSFTDNKTVAKMLNSEAGMLNALVINERAKAACGQRWAEHEAAHSFLLSELVRRRSLAESWRYRIPKYLMPLLAGFHAAGISSRVFRDGSKFKAEVLKLLVEYAKDGVTPAMIFAAMALAEDQFTALLSQADDPFGAEIGPDYESNPAADAASNDAVDAPSPGIHGEPEAERFEDRRRRLFRALAEKEEALSSIDGWQDEKFEDAEKKIRGYRLALGMGGGLTSSGIIMFPSVVDFVSGLDTAHQPGAEAATDKGLASMNPAAEPANPATESAHPDLAGEALLNGSGGDLFEHGSAGRGNSQASATLQDAEQSALALTDVHSAAALVQTPEAAQEHATDSWPKVAKGPAATSEPLSESAPPSGTYAHEMVSGTKPSPTLVIEPIDPWPRSRSDPRVVAAELTRSQGFNMSVSAEQPFAGWVYTPAERPFSHVPMRAVVLADRPQGELTAIDTSRLELPNQMYEATIVDGRSRILGLGHHLMLVPHGSLEWYAEQLGWEHEKKCKITAFGNPMKPSTLRASGDAALLMGMLIDNVELRLKKIPQEYNDGFFNDINRLFAAKIDLARWWAFVLLARHDPEVFEPVFGPGFFHGVEAPDFFLDSKDNAVFGPSHIRLAMPQISEIEKKRNPWPTLASLGYGSNMRRIIQC